MTKVFRCAMDDMAIAAQSVQHSGLGRVIGTRKLLCEVYYKASVGEHTFFLQVYDGDPFLLVRTRPEVSDYLGLHTGGGSFSRAVEADLHPACKGDIFHSVKYLPKDDRFLQELFSCLPVTEEFAVQCELIIDGSTCVICDHRCEEPVCLAFQTVDAITNNIFTHEQKKFLNDLFAAVEQTFNSSKKYTLEAAATCRADNIVIE